VSRDSEILAALVPMVERVARVLNGGSSFANKWARQQCLADAARAIESLTDADLLVLLNDRIAHRYEMQTFRERWAAGLRAQAAVNAGNIDEAKRIVAEAGVEWTAEDDRHVANLKEKSGKVKILVDSKQTQR